MLKCFILEAKPPPLPSPNMVIWGTFPSKYSFRFFVVTQNRNRCCWREGEENEKFLRWYAVHYTAFETFWALWVSFSFRVFFFGVFFLFFSPVGVSGGENNETETTFELLLHAIDYQNFMLSTRKKQQQEEEQKWGWYRANGDLESDIKSNFIMHIKF